MILVIALPDLALRLSEILTGACYVVRVYDAADLRHRIHSYQPDIVLLDWRIGGSAWKAMDEVTAIVERTTTHPYVIAMLPKTTTKIRCQAAKIGCYNVVNVDAAGSEQRVLDVVAVAKRARWARRPAPRRVSREGLH